MSYHSIIEYIQGLTQIYFSAAKKKKTQLLDDASKITGRHRKSLIRLLGSKRLIENNKKSNCGAKKKYTDDLLPHIKCLWIAMDRIDPKRMKPALENEDWLPKYHENGITQNQKRLIREMSVSTLSRFISKIRSSSEIKKGLNSTSPARHMKNKVPINTLDSKVENPGFVQADTVAHCGDRLEGTFMNSITLTDIYSTWTDNRAIFTKKGREVRSALVDIKINLPFDLKAINTDSGSEFLNTPVFNLFNDKKVKFTRSRPYKKNDNCYVEQKNFTHARELFGYQRFEHIELKELMNEIYTKYWNPYLNFFIPTFKLKEKIRIGARIKKIYDTPKTPYQRLMESSSLSEKQKKELSMRKKELNPFELKKVLEKKLAEFFKKLEYLDRCRELDRVTEKNFRDAA